MRTPNHPVGSLITTVRRCCATAPAGATSSAIIPKVSTADRDSNIPLLHVITLEPPQGSRRNKLTRGDTRSHRRQVVLVNDRIVGCGRQSALGGLRRVVERCGARAVASSRVADLGGDVVEG